VVSSQILMKRIGLFGGTFDPPHRAHTEIARMAYDQLKLDQVIFIPCQLSPHKQESEPAAAEKRLKMISIALESADWAVVSDIELLQKGVSYAIDTVQHFKAKFEEATLFWIMGSDQWEVFDTWHESGALARLLEFIVFPRPDVPQPQAGKKLHVIDQVIDISSSEVRQRISLGKTVGDFLEPNVERYIRSEGLYL